MNKLSFSLLAIFLISVTACSSNSETVVTEDGSTVTASTVNVYMNEWEVKVDPNYKMGKHIKPGKLTLTLSNEGALEHSLILLNNNKRSSSIYWFIFLGLIFFAIIVDYWGWLFFLTFIYLMTRLRHPPTMDDEKPIEIKRFVLGILAIIFLIISFPPVPFMT